jgi:hypothetical protein
MAETVARVDARDYNPRRRNHPLVLTFIYFQSCEG